MGVTVATTRVACTVDTAPYTQDITTADLGGLTPKAALFTVTYGVTDGTAADNASWSYGAATGASNEWAGGGFVEHNVGTVNNFSLESDALCIHLVDNADVDEGTAEFSAFITNGVRINWTSAPAGAYLLTVVLFAGSDLSAYAGTADLANTEDLVVDVTAPGFEPDDIICMVVRDGTHARGGHGFVHNTGNGPVQRASAYHFYSGLATSFNGSRTTNSGGVMECSSAGGVQYYGEFGDFDANGFSVTVRGGTANWPTFGYLALAYNGTVESWVGTHTTPTSTGNDSETGPGFTPQIVLMLSNIMEAIDTAYQEDLAGVLGISAFDTDDEYSNAIAHEDNVGTTNSQSLSDDRAIVVTDDAGSLDIEATFVTFDANGWTVNYSNAPATAKLFPALAIGAEAEEEVTTVGTVNGRKVRGSIIMPENDPLDKGLVGEWRFDRNTGKVVPDYSGRRSSVDLTGTPNWITTPVGTALELDGTNDWIDCAAAANHISFYEGTLELLLRRDFAAADAATDFLVFLRFDDTHRIRIYHSGSSADLTYNYRMTGSINATPAMTFYPQYEWVHAVFTWSLSADTIAAYADGVFVESAGGLGDPAGNVPTLFNIGSEAIGGGSSWWDGGIALVRAYNRALIPNEVQARYQISRRRMQTFGGERKFSIAFPARRDYFRTVSDSIGIADLLTKRGTFFIRPDGDQSVGQWTDELDGTTNIYQSIDEPAPAVDSDYIQSPFAPQTQSYICTLSDALDPGIDTGHILSYRYRKFPVTNQQVDLTVTFLQGAAELIFWQHNNVTSGWVTVNQLIPSGIVANITDYTDLRLRFEADIAL